jgi:hypothetical protein
MRALPIVLRVAVAVAGGYGLSAGLSALLAATLAATGVLPRSEAVLASVVLAFAIYLVILLWAFAEPLLWRLIAIVAIGTPLTFWLARLLAAGLEAAG